MEDVCVCVGDFLVWFLKEKKNYITLLLVSMPVTHFNSLSSVFQAGQMGGDLSGPKIVYSSLQPWGPMLPSPVLVFDLLG